MMHDVTICERWPMKLAREPDGSFLDWVLKSPKEASKHITAGFLAYRSLYTVYEGREMRSAREYFGGIGAQSLIIRALWRPVYHTITDNNPGAVSHLRRELRAINVRLADAYDPAEAEYADLVGLDFGDLTAWRTRLGEPHRALLNRVFDPHPKAVVLTDVAGPRLALQRDRYENLMHRDCSTYVSYLWALVNRLTEIYDYKLHRGYYDRWSAVMAFVPNGVGDLGYLHPKPERPVGLTFAHAETAGRRRGMLLE